MFCFFIKIADFVNSFDIQTEYVFDINIEALNKLLDYSSINEVEELFNRILNEKNSEYIYNIFEIDKINKLSDKKPLYELFVNLMKVSPKIIEKFITRDFLNKFNQNIKSSKEDLFIPVI